MAGYGAPGKGNTLLNHAGIREDLLDYTVDRSTFKQGMYLPGTHIPIHRPGDAGRDPARLHPDPAVEPPRGDLRPAGVHPPVGRELVVPLPRLEIF